MTDLFAGKDPATETNDLAQWVGEGKKYSTNEAALAALPHSQSHIAKLEEDNKTLREQAEALTKKVEEGEGATNADVLEAIQKLKAPASTPVTPAIDEKAIDTLLDQKLEDRTQAQIAEANRLGVQSKLLELYGDATKASAAVEAKANDLGTTVAALRKLSEQQPQLILSQFTKTEVGEPVIKPVPTPIVTDPALDPAVQAAPGTKSYFDNMRRKDPKRYHSAEILEERAKAITEQGVEAYNKT